MLYVEEKRGRISRGSGRESRGEETMDIIRKEGVWGGWGGSAHAGF